MTDLDIYKAQVARAKCHFRKPVNVKRLTRAQEEIETSHACGLGCSLTEAETEALSIFITGQKAAVEVRRLTAASESKIIPFPNPTTPHYTP